MIQFLVGVAVGVVAMTIATVVIIVINTKE